MVLSVRLVCLMMHALKKSLDLKNIGNSNIAKLNKNITMLRASLWNKNKNQYYTKVLSWLHYLSDFPWKVFWGKLLNNNVSSLCLDETKIHTL